MRGWMRVIPGEGMMPVVEMTPVVGMMLVGAEKTAPPMMEAMNRPATATATETATATGVGAMMVEVEMREAMRGRSSGCRIRSATLTT